MIKRLLSPFRKGAAFDPGSHAGAVPAAASLAARATAIPLFRNSEAAFNGELQRARRYERPLSVVVLTVDNDPPSLPEPEPPEGGGEAILLETHLPHLVSLLIGSILSRVLRESDLLAHDVTTDRFVILLPETDGAEAARAVTRLDRIMKQRLCCGVRAGVATFPERGLTLAEIVESAGRRWHESPIETADSFPAIVHDRNGSGP